MKIRFLLLFAIYLLYGCHNNSNELKRIKVVLKYKNGNIFCEGFHSVNIKNDSPKNRVGEWKFYYPDGILESINKYDKFGERTEVWKTYYPDGKLESIKEYDKGVLLEWETYYPNSNLKSIIEYDKILKKVKLWKTYFSDCKLEKIYEYDDDVLVNRKEYDVLGNLIFSEVFKNNITYTVNYKNGKIESESEVISTVYENEDDEETYKTFKEYYDNGQLFSQSTYVNDIPNGAYSRWDTSGKLILNIEYKNGLVLIK